MTKAVMVLKLQEYVMQGNLPMACCKQSKQSRCQQAQGAVNKLKVFVACCDNSSNYGLIVDKNMSAK